ncbi:MAG: prepilin peptidase [Micavibrio sp.]|nr:prepilin peptidase [Micavibrio sp.]|tara:strand:- start:118 stop:639 length:522 start_codon:yes stop_codon:yes gene_type:complete
MLEIFALLCVIGGIVILGALAYIDLKTYLLPNELVLGLACCGFVFHLSTLFHYVTLEDMALGAIIGGGLLYVIRGLANYWYDEDTLGLGDVKLLTAGGLWLGPEHILIAAAAGALAGFFHGVIIAIYTIFHAKVPVKSFDLSRLSVPAGPGFAAGLLCTAIYMFCTLPEILLP